MTDLRLALAAPLWVVAMFLPAAVAAAEHAAGGAPLEQLRVRLAERLAASQGAGAGQARELRVAAKPAAASSAGLVASVPPAPPAAPSAHHAPAVKPPAALPAAPPAVVARAATVKSVAAHASVPAPPKAALAATRPVAVAHKEGGATQAAHAPAHWDYHGPAGPQAWGGLQPQFSMCSTGQRQSPIDIREGLAVDLEPVQFNYQASGFAVVDNGHTVQVNVGTGNSIEVMGRRYELVQFHFHRPSEERIDGRQFDMVAHLVHKDLDGRLAVVAVLLERGSAQPLVQSIWNNLPLEKGEEVAARSTINLNDLLPAERNYFTYMGSLTTPPCSEGVLWMVMKQPVQLSADQIGIFARLYPMNARPVQSAAGRLIKESN
jgi:carbonic anhydrase